VLLGSVAKIASARRLSLGANQSRRKPYLLDYHAPVADIEVRWAAPEEFASAGDVVVAAYKALPNQTVLAGGYADELADVATRALEAEVLVAVKAAAGYDGGPAHAGKPRIVGCVTLVTDRTSRWAEMLKDGEAGVRMMGVHPDFQGRGAGRALLEACVQRAGQLGKRALFLHTTPWMAAAHHLYSSCGFIREPGRDWLPAPDIPLLAFRLDIG